MIKKIIIIALIGFHPILYCQKSKYLLFDTTKDSIITLNKIKYYKIDKNLFDMNRFNEVDTIGYNEMSNYKFITVKRLWIEGEKLFLKVSMEKNLVLESYNQIFERIYVLEKIAEKKYKKTRVWWIDY